MAEHMQASLAQNTIRLKEKLLQWLPEQGMAATAIDGLALHRRDVSNQSETCFFKPTIGFVVQGFKRSVIGNEEYRYGEGSSLVAGVDMPSISQIMEASPEQPFLSLSMKLDRYLVTQLASEVPPASTSGAVSYRAVAVAEAAPEALDACLRLVELLDTPARIPVLAPLILREIYYHLLTGPQGECLRMISTHGTQSNQIAKAISWLRENYKEPLQIEQLARQVHMAESTFHRHFRHVTTLSPLQFQKRLRLYEAQRLMLAEGMDAAAAALEVGYESATQFNREYKRQFGQPPRRDISNMLLVGSPAEPVMVQDL